MKKNKYYSPSVSVEEVNIEKGFAGSGVVENDYAADGEAGMLQEGNTYEF